MADDDIDIRLAVLEKSHDDHIKLCADRWREVMDAIKSLRQFLLGTLVTFLLGAIAFAAQAIMQIH